MASVWLFHLNFILTLHVTVVLSSPLGGSTIPALPSSLQVLSHSSFKSNLYFCRIRGVCRVGDGTILLPTWMKSHAEHIDSCGMKNVLFAMNENLNSSSLRQGLLWTPLQHGLTLDDEYRENDLLGGEAPSADQHALATHITPLLHFLDVLCRPSVYSDVVNGICVKEGSNLCPQWNSSRQVSSLNPVLLVDSRISNTKDFQWPKSILRLIRSSLFGNFQYVDQQDLYSWKVKTKASCFRSLISTNVQTSDIPSGSISTGNMFFTENGLVRTSAKKGLNAIAQCIVKVLILNRFGQRFIEGAETLSSAISAYGKLVSESARHVSIQPEVVFFENSSFHEQVSVVQEADVIVATHGESIANIMFARPDTHMFEILPFGFISDIYQNLSIAYGVKYHRITAQPDPQVFIDCVRHFNPKFTEGRERLIKLWQLHADTFRNGTIERGKNIISSYIVPEYVGGRFNTPTIRKLRECAAYQRVSVDVRDLAHTVVYTAAKQCPIHSDLTLLQG